MQKAASEGSYFSILVQISETSRGWRRNFEHLLFPLGFLSVYFYKLTWGRASLLTAKLWRLLIVKNENLLETGRLSPDSAGLSLKTSLRPKR